MKLSIFWNYIPNKRIKCDYRQPNWLKTWNSLLKKKLSWLNIITKIGQKKEDHEKLLAKANNCTKEILEAKNEYILTMNSKCNNSYTAPKTYWMMLNRSLYKTKIPAITTLRTDGNKDLFPIFVKKQVFSIAFLA